MTASYWSHSGINITWSHPADQSAPAYYIIEYKTVGKWVNLTEKPVSGHVTSYHWRTPSRGTTYHFRLLGVDGSMTRFSQPSQEFAVNTFSGRTMPGVDDDDGDGGLDDDDDGNNGLDDDGDGGLDDDDDGNNGLDDDGDGGLDGGGGGGDDKGGGDDDDIDDDDDDYDLGDGDDDDDISCG